MSHMENAPTPTELSGLAAAQVAWRFFRNLKAEFVAEGAGTFSVVVAVEDENAVQVALGETLASLKMTMDHVRLVDANTARPDDIRRILDTSTVLAGDVARTIGNPSGGWSTSTTMSQSRSAG